MTQLHTDWIQQVLHKNKATTEKVKSPGPLAALKTDSRKVAAGDLFAAIRGDRLDGHDFVSSALEKGAGLVLVEEVRPEWKNDDRILKVKNVVNSLRLLARDWLDLFPVPRIMVAGSVGKTTTKELLRAILSAKHSSFICTEGSQNGFLGIPLTILNLRPEHSLILLEVGIDEIGAMEQHLELIRPDWSILTSIAPEHLEKLKDLKTVAKEEWQAVSNSHLRPFHAVIPWDDDEIQKKTQAQKTSPVLVTLNKEIFLREMNATDHRFYWGDVKNTSEGKVMEVASYDQRRFQVRSPLPGKHNDRNLLLALALATEMGLTPFEIQQGLNNFHAVQGRSQWIELGKDLRLFADLYNANPASMQAALEVIQQADRPSLLILGDMLELGPEELRYHAEVGQNVLSVFGKKLPKMVFLFGPRMKSAGKILEGKIPYFWTDQFSELESQYRQWMADHSGKLGDILVKGSRGMKLERLFPDLVKFY